MVSELSVSPVMLKEMGLPWAVVPVQAPASVASWTVAAAATVGVAPTGTDPPDEPPPDDPPPDMAGLVLAPPLLVGTVGETGRVQVGCMVRVGVAVRAAEPGRG